MSGAFSCGEKIPNVGPVRTGNRLEIPLRRVAPSIAIFCGLSWFGLYVHRKLWGNTPQSMLPDFQREAHRLEGVAVRQHAPPVFRNPFRNNIPGHIRGPDDLPGHAA